MSWYAIESVSDAFDESKDLLFPFDLKRWLVLAVITFFTGGAGGGASSFNQSFSSPPDSGGMPDVPFSWELVAAVILVLLVLWLVFLVVSSVMEFVFVDALRSRDVRIRGSFGTRTGPGLRLAGFRAGLFVAALVVMALVAVPIALAVVGGTPVALLALVLTVPLAIVLFIVLFVVEDFTTAFVVPLICADGGGIVATWQDTLLPAARAEWKQFGVYVLVKVGLGIAIGFAVGVVMVFVGLPILLLFGAGLLAGGLSVVFIATAVLMLVVLFVLAFVFVQMPISVFMRYYSLLVLDSSPIEWTLPRTASSDV